MLETIDRFSLDGVGQEYPMCISRYDTVNECYWMVSASAVTVSTNIGELTKVGKYMKDGKLEVLGRWYLSSDETLTNAFFSGVDVTLDGSYIFMTITNNSAAQSGAGFVKLSVNSDGTLGQNSVASGGTIIWNKDTTGTSTVFDSTTTYYPFVARLDDNKAVVVYRDNDNSGYGTACVLDISNDGTIAPGTPVVFESSSIFYPQVVALTNTKAIVSADAGEAYILDITGSTITVGTAETFASGTGTYSSIAKLSDTKAIVTYQDSSNSDYGTACILDVSGSAITAGTPTVFESADVEWTAVVGLSSTKAVVCYRDTANSNYGTACVLDITGSAISAGTPEVFETSSTWYIKATKLDNTRAVVVYSDFGGSSYGTACALSISGSTVTPGTPVVFESASVDYPSVMAINSTTALVGYSDGGNSGYGTMCELDISGTTITANTPEVFYGAQVQRVDISVLDNPKVVMVYRDVSATNYGSAIVANIPADFSAEDSLDRVADGNYYPDCTVWDENHVAILKVADNTNDNLVSIIFKQIEDDGDGAFVTTDPRDDIDGFEVFTGQAANSAEQFCGSICKSGNTLWMKVNQYTPDYRFIYKFDVSEDSYTTTITQDSEEYTGDIIGYLDSSGSNPTVIKASGRFGCTDAWRTGSDPRGDSISKEGICVSSDGHILEVISSATGADTSKFLEKRALSEAKWAENQVCEEFPMLTDAYSGDSSIPDDPFGCMVDSNGWYYTSEGTNVAQDNKIYRYKPDGTVNSLKVTGATSLWVYVLDLTTDGTDIFLLGISSTHTEVVKCTKSYLDTQLDSDTDVNIDDGVNWTHSSGIGTSYTSIMYGICYDSDNDILYLANDGLASVTDKIATLSTDLVTFDNDAYDLPAPTGSGYWRGIAYKNNNIYIVDDGVGSGTKIYVLPVDKLNATAMWRSHIYQSPSTDHSYWDIMGIDFDGNNLIGTSFGFSKFILMKVLEDPDVMQLHMFADSYNILLSDNIGWTTDIAERYFDPVDFADIRDCPDLHYMVAGYWDEGFSILHLDEFLSGRSSSGMPRYDVTAIRAQHYKRSNSTGGPHVDGNIVSSDDNAWHGSSASIEKDMIFVMSETGTWPTNIMIDLKAGTSTIFKITNNCGSKYNGSLTQRNDNLGYNGIHNPELELGDEDVQKIHVRTFTKDDVSDYNGENPKTFVAMATNTTVELLVIDWDNNNDRTPVKVWNNVLYDATYDNAVFISPDGILFAGQFTSSGNMVYMSDTGSATASTTEPALPVWEVANDQVGRTTIGSNVLGTIVRDISPNSYCWKSQSGEWRHVLPVACQEDASAGELAVGLFDVENETIEWMYWVSTVAARYRTVDNFEDMIITGYDADSIANSTVNVWRKYHSVDGTNVYALNNWAYFDLGAGTRPMFMPTTIGIDVHARYSKDFGILSIAKNSAPGGLQMVFFGHQRNNSTQESVEVSVDNIESTHLVQTVVDEASTKAEIVLRSEATFTDGSGEVWTNLGSVEAADSAGDYLEPVSNESYGAGTFGDPANILKKSDGSALVEDTDFQYDKRLDASTTEDSTNGFGSTAGGIYDTNNSGVFDSGKYFRVVEDGTNVTASGELNLEVYAKDLSSISSPPSDRIYIDPAAGKVVVPRPSYWSKCESLASITSPEIEDGGYLSTLTNSPNSYPSAKFGNGAMSYSGTNAVKTYFSVTPMTSINNYSKGTISKWVKYNDNGIGAWSYAGPAIGGSFTHGSLAQANYLDITPWGIALEAIGGTRIAFMIGSSQQDSYTITGDYNMHHLFVVWDDQNGLSGSKSLRVFWDGTEVLSYTGTLPSTTGYDMISMVSAYNYLGNHYQVIIDNLKYWHDDTIEDPSFEYNSGTGRELALHNIYGSTNGYVPQLTGASDGVGYFFIPDVSNPATLNEDSITQGYLELESITGIIGAGIKMVAGSDGGIATITVTDETELSVHASGEIDLYNAENGEVGDLEYTYWVALEEDHEYTIRMEHSGTHNASASADYSIRMRDFITISELEAAEAESTLYIRHSDHLGESRSYTLTPGETTDLYETANFDGTGSGEVFTLTGSNRASNIVRVSKDSGTTWVYPGSITYDWGTNDPDYDDEIIDSDGYFSVKFEDAPDSGTGNVRIQYIPKSTDAKVLTTMKLANDGSSFTDITKPFRLVDYAVELI
jgi:hypothetical protein